MNAFPAKLIIERGQVRTENSNKPHGFGVLNPAAFTPYPKNPVIARFFRQIGRADELGSGMRNMMKYGKAFGSADPELIEGDFFRIIVKCPDLEARQTGADELRPESLSRLESRLESLLAAKVMLLIKNIDTGKAQLAIGLGHKTVSGELHKQIKRLLDLELIEMTLPDKLTSRLQKYRLTDAGKHLLASMQDKAE